MGRKTKKVKETRPQKSVVTTSKEARSMRERTRKGTGGGEQTIAVLGLEKNKMGMGGRTNVKP